jgi:hypothetical protein
MKNVLIIAAIVLAADSLSAESLRGVVPVVGSTAGAFGSNFRTELQLHNRSSIVMKGRLVFHPQGRSASASDASISFLLEPRQTVHYVDVVASLGQSGLGSLDVMVEDGGVPSVVARAFDDKGEAGTSGATVALIEPSSALRSGDSAALLTPSDRTNFRFNVGVRTLSALARLRISIYGANGVLRKPAFERSYAPSYFEQRSGDSFADDVLLADEAIVVEVLEGEVVLYGSTTDNKTNDPSIEIVRR